MKRPGILIALMLFLLFAVNGCGKVRETDQERQDIEFTVVEQRKLPEELQQIIEDNKKEEIRMSYADGEDLYLIRGYGEQKTGGYSIAVKECSEDEESILLDTQLIGPKDTRELSEEPSFPYLAIKIEMREEKEILIQ